MPPFNGFVARLPGYERLPDNQRLLKHFSVLSDLTARGNDHQTILQTGPIGRIFDTAPVETTSATLAQCIVKQ
jgi:hypothetical protein